MQRARFARGWHRPLVGQRNGRQYEVRAQRRGAHHRVSEPFPAPGLPLLPPRSCATPCCPAASPPLLARIHQQIVLLATIHRSSIPWMQPPRHVWAVTGALPHEFKNQNQVVARRGTDVRVSADLRSTCWFSNGTAATACRPGQGHHRGQQWAAGLHQIAPAPLCRAGRRSRSQPHTLHTPLYAPLAVAHERYTLKANLPPLCRRLPVTAWW